MSISEPATALPVGWAQISIDGRVVTFDTTRFRPGPSEGVVRVHFDGRITVGPVQIDASWPSLGPRCFGEPWKDGAGGYTLESSPVIVLGIVV